MDTKDVVEKLQTNMNVIHFLFLGMPDELYRWKPAPDRWSVLEVLNHLTDEEIEDFRFRSDLLLHNPEKDWTALNSWDWVETREYNKRDPDVSVKAFETARRESLKWLRKLTDPKWNNLHAGKRAGGPNLRAGDILVSWIAHDYFHIAQITKLSWEYWNEKSLPYSTDYAGRIDDLP